MSNETTIEAIFRMKPESEGGRYSACGVNYRPHLVVPPSTEYLGIVVVKVLDSEEEKTIRPGETAVVELRLPCADTVCYDSLVEGAEFEIREGGKIVGTGTVIRRTERAPWTPKSRITTAASLPFLSFIYSVLVIHCGAEWNHIDTQMDFLLQEFRKDYSKTIGFYALDLDDERNWDFLEEAKVLNISALVCFINEVRYETLIGMRSKEELIPKFEEWLTLIEQKQDIE